jgi:hypothetical protein
MDKLALPSVDTAVDKEGGTYELERKGNGWIRKYDEPEYYIQDTVTEWFDELSNLDLMRLTIWCYKNNIELRYNFR